MPDPTTKSRPKMRPEKHVVNYQVQVKQLGDGTFLCRLDGQVAGLPVKGSGSSGPDPKALAAMILDWTADACERLADTKLDDAKLPDA